MNLVFMWLQELNPFKYDSKNWTFWKMTLRIVFFNMIQRIVSFFFEIWVTELSVFQYDSKNWTLFSKKYDSKNTTFLTWPTEFESFFDESKNWTFFFECDSNNWFFECDSNNWIFWVWLSESQNWTLFVSEYDFKNWTWLKNTRIENFFQKEWTSFYLT